MTYSSLNFRFATFNLTSPPNLFLYPFLVCCKMPIKQDVAGREAQQIGYKGGN
jgi:hypothetical protein